MQCETATGAPLPLAPDEADERALQLRRLGLNYYAISTIMRAYHGIARTDNAWRNRLRRRGAPGQPRGSMQGLHP